MIIDSPKQDQIPELCTLWREAFGDGEDFFNIFLDTAYSAERCRCLTIDGSVAAALYWLDCEYESKKIAYLYAIATKKGFRGRGLCRALMDDTHEHLRIRGYSAAILVPSEPSLFGFYEKTGYKTCSSIGEFSCRAADKSIVLTQIDKHEYATLRPAYLPPKSVIQEGENLDFLAAQAKLYKGESFLLAASEQDSELSALELLGDLSYAPEIVRALGCKTGNFRTVGSSRPFAMYLPLTDENEAPPSYLGFAFD